MSVHKRVAFGLTKHPAHGYRHLLGRFSQHVNASTYWDIYEDEDLLGAAVMAERIIDMMYTAQSIHFNLDGLLTDNASLIDIYQRGALGAGEGNWTNWEFYIIVSNEAFFGKTTFYFDGIIEQDELVYCGWIEN